MSKKVNLTSKDVESAKPRDAAYRIHDGKVPGLFLRVMPSGVKSWNVTWARNRDLSLGKWPGVTVEAARAKARAKLTETDQHGAPLKVIEANRPEADKPISLGDFVEQEFRPWALANLKAGQATLDALRSVWGGIYDMMLTEVRAVDVERIKTARLLAGREPSTVNRDLDRIRGVFSRAVEWGRLPIHPLVAVKRTKGVDNSRARYLDAGEEGRLRNALAAREMRNREQRDSGNEWRRKRSLEEIEGWPDEAFTDHLMPIVLLAMNTGLRRGEIFNLQWSDVNLSRRILTVATGSAKSRRHRHVNLNDEAADVLTRWKRQAIGTGLVFPGAGGLRLSSVTTAWEGLRDSAGLVDFTFHDLRHHFASSLAMAGVDLNTIRQLLGHADIAMTLRYAHLAPEKLADAVAKIRPRYGPDAGTA